MTSSKTASFCSTPCGTPHGCIGLFMKRFDPCRMVSPPTPLEAALAEAIRSRGLIHNEDEALKVIKENHSILYLASDDTTKGDVAYYQGGGGEHDEEVKDVLGETKPTIGFRPLSALGLAGGILIKHFPLDTDSLSPEDAEEVVEMLADLPRPITIVCTTGHVSNAVKHLYVGRMAGLKTEEHIREMGCKFDPPEKEMVWLDDSPTKAWVLGSLQQHNVA